MLRLNSITISFLGEAKRRFENLKKRFSKKKKALKKATRSGAGSNEASAAANELREYEFLSWLSPFMRLKNTDDNLPNSSKISAEENINEEGSEEEDDGDSIFGHDDDSIDVTSERSSSVTSREKLDTKPSQTSTKNREKWSKKKTKDATEIELMKKITTAIEGPPAEPKEQDADDIFGMMVAKELKSLHNKKKRKLKHEINNLIFQYQEEEDEESTPNIMNSTFQTQTTNTNFCPQIPPWKPNLSSAQMPVNATWPLAGLNINLDKQL